MIASIGKITLAATLLAAPLAARGDVRLLDVELRPPSAQALHLTLALAQAQGADGKSGSAESEKPADPRKPAGEAATPGGLDFDLLGEAKPPPVPVSDRSMKRRRKMLGIHQTAGIGLVGLHVATTVVGQLNYNDKFGDSNTGRYKLSHQILAYSTVGVFAANGLLALLAPDPPHEQSRGFDRVSLHKLGMFTAAAGMAAQVALGIYTAHREGYENKQDFGRIHLVVGYATLAAVATGVGALVF